MLTNLLDNNVTGQILSGVLGALIAFIASFLLLRFNYKDLFAKTVSQDRIVWLKQMREYAENLFHYIRNNDCKEQRDYNGKTYYDYAEPILLRLNLDVDEDSDEGRIITLIRGDFKTLKDNLNCDNKNDLIRLFRSMLKDEWEKVKCEAKGYEELSNKNRFETINLSKWIVKGILFISLYVLIGIIIGFYLFPKIDKVAVIVMGWVIYGLAAVTILFLNLVPTLFKNIKTKEKGVEKTRMNKKPFYKTLWFWLIVVGLILFVGNILVLLLVKNDGQSAWLTLISGWVSGIATLVIGLMAFWQNNKFTCDSRKRDLIFKVTSFMTEFQDNIVTKIDIENLYRIYHQIYETTFHIADPNYVANAQIEINRDMLTFTKSIINYESILLRGCFYSQEIIKLHKTILTLSDKLNEYDLADLENASKIQYTRDHCDEVAKFITDWSDAFFNISKEIMLKFQKEKINILKIYKLKDLVAIENASYVEEKNITDYFSE